MELSIFKTMAIDRVSNAVAAGTTDVNCTGVDMSGHESVAFLVLFGTITGSAVTSLQIDHSDDNSSYNACASSKLTVADTMSNKVGVVECVRPQKRYLRCTIDRGTANAVIDGVVAIRFRSTKAPVTQGATIIGGTVIIGSETGTP